jgi:hypothetical protein
MTNNQSVASCTLSINICVADYPFIQQTIPHLVRSCRYPFTERMIVIDTAPMQGRYRKNFSLSSLDELEKIAYSLVDNGYIDSVIKVDYKPAIRKPIVEKHLGSPIWETHDFRNAPIYAYLFAYEAANTDYFLHFDSDMLLYQAQDYNWIKEGIKYLSQYPDILTITPLPGPPNKNLELKQRDISYNLDPRGFFTFKVFTARRYLLNCKRFDSFLPLPLNYSSWKRQLLSYFTRRSAIERWEGMMTNKLVASNYIRADLASPKAWTLHALEHSQEFLKILPEIIARVEEGNYPVDQAGEYDLQLGLWQDFGKILEKL